MNWGRAAMARAGGMLGREVDKAEDRSPRRGWHLVGVQGAAESRGNDNVVFKSVTTQPHRRVARRSFFTCQSRYPSSAHRDPLFSVEVAQLPLQSLLQLTPLSPSRMSTTHPSYWHLTIPSDVRDLIYIVNVSVPQSRLHRPPLTHPTGHHWRRL